ncbi:endonuclease/exonuclease/phosphatase family protein [Hydrogenimonas thermophila]|uniref:Endonuclease/Exonuclease/phosphatase family protein n=1 Tax=Hydrogenimonas thermophila TaxID=223786 RepID=A0A1I5PUL5_9BACT|nr:endonuclease/exonuclease/phosphatase family protein [Hydrogenimonas thermophila]SFP37540.1 Endonuclease/Exonuclease/phosphatase family protein [Hydrogenimonas thermophila]
MKNLIILFILSSFLLAKDFRVASYNVENLFDLQRSGSEYTEYIPFTKYGWNKRAFNIKVNNIAQVICDMKPDIIGLQEIESDYSLKALQIALKRCGLRMPYRAIANKKPSTVKTALLSKYPIIKKREIDPDGKLRSRNILEVLLNVAGRRLFIFVNHWKSRSGAESRRITSAKALMKRLLKLPKNSDYILLGDFNSNWDEYKTILRTPRLNDTNGITGINHILKTIKDDKLVTKFNIRWPYHYDLWLELPPEKRWSHNFFGKKSALDHIILPYGMFDNKGINYKDKTFHVFKPNYLIKRDGSIFRWQVSEKGYGKHLNRGYSDHLPIYAEFTTKPFILTTKKVEVESPSTKLEKNIAHISDLYNMPLGWKNITIPEAVVIYKKPPFAILKEPNDRAILVYKDINALRYSHKYKVLVKDLYEYRGLREITKLKVLKDLGKRYINNLLLKNFKDLNKKEYINEVVKKITGKYRDGYLYYKNGKKIKIYFKNGESIPVNNETVTLKNIRIGLYKNKPELVVE